MKSFLTLLAVTLVTTVQAQNVNRPVPEGLAPYAFVQNGVAPGYYLTSTLKLDAPEVPTIPIILDANGFVVWYTIWPEGALCLDFKYVEEDSRFGLTTLNLSDMSCEFFLFDTGLTQQSSFVNVDVFNGDTHEFVRMANGNYLVSAQSDSVMDLSAYTFGGIQGATDVHAYGFVIQELDSDNNLIFEWDSNDHIHPSEWVDTYPYNPYGFDYCHGNAVAEDVDGNLLVSFRHLDAVYKIDRNTGDVIWRLGGSSSDFTFPNDTGFSGQHDVRVLPGGILSLFDNGNSGDDPKKSRALEYTLDTVNWTATKVWEYIHTPACYSPAMGNHHFRPDDGLHLINYGLNYRPDPSMVLTNALGQVINEVQFSDSVVSYRSYFEDLPFEPFRPEVSCHTVGGQVQLVAESGHNTYTWSTGESNPSIWASTPGVYQVWVDYGVGMAGSHPIEVTASGCAAGMPELISDQDEIWSWYDLLGRPCTERQPGNVYIGISNRGATRREVAVP